MEIVTYPLDGYRYDAADAAGYFSTRQSGVYSAAEDFAVTVDGSTSVTVSAGRAWMHPDRWTGYSIICRENQTVKLPAADGTRTRIDRIVLRYDAAARKTSLLVLEGTPDSSSPAAPAITRTALVYDLCLAEIRRTAGSTAVTSADITDTRTDEDVCGIMRDGATGIPTETLLAQWQAAQAQQDAEARQAAAEMLRAAQEQITAQLDSLQQQADELQTAIDNVESGSFYTKAEVDALVRPYSLPAATSTTLGGIKVGDNLTIDADGTLSGAAPYALPAATTSTRGGVKAGSNLTVYADGTLSLEKSGVTGALGYTPAQVTAGTYDLTSGSSYLATGALYVQYATGTSDEAVDDTDIHMPEDESAQDGEPVEADEEVQA